jgi:hypothetical protein
MATETVETPESSNIARYGFGEKLFVEFKSGDRWEYDAPWSVFDQMRKARSAGSFFHAQVKGQYEGRKQN